MIETIDLRVYFHMKRDDGCLASGEGIPLVLLSARGTVFIIKLERRTPGHEPVIMWLRIVSPPRWGNQEDAIKFATKGEARRAAASMKLAGAWSIEDARD